MTVKEPIDKLQQFIGVKMIEAVHMIAREANDKGYKIGNHSFEEDGYEVNSINANGLYVIRKAGSNRAGFIKFDD